MNLRNVSMLGLAALFTLAQVTAHILGIFSMWFYMPFHFLGGFLWLLLCYSFTRKFSVSVVATMIIGILWEVYEFALWKYFLRQGEFYPETGDTILDLILDFLGAMAAVIWLRKSTRIPHR